MTTTISTPEPQTAETAELVPVTGVFELVGNQGILRAEGYLPGPDDAHLSMNQVRQYGLRRGDFITGAVRSSRVSGRPDAGTRPDGGGRGGRGNRRDNPRDTNRAGAGAAPRDNGRALARIDTINGRAPGCLGHRPDFADLTPLYPQERLRLETAGDRMATRLIDLVAPIGKGQRGLIVAPPKAGKTVILQSLAAAIAHNHPECHLMVVLLDERPEEVTDMRRSVKGEVLASTFDRPPKEHTSVADLAIERAKRLVEQGEDVVILLDSLTRLCRAYNNSAASNGRTLSGGVDAAALHHPKRIFGAARNIEHGGSLTILATALVETGSRADDYYFEELKSTGNMELRLDSALAGKRLFPAVNVESSGTRKEELITPAAELSVLHKLRRVLHDRDATQSIELLLERMKKTGSNAEFLLQVNQSAA